MYNHFFDLWEFYDLISFNITNFWTIEFLSWRVLFTFFLPEIVLFCLILYILIYMIIGLHFQRNRKNVALELISVTQNTFFLIVTIYTFLLSQKVFGFFSEGQIVLSAYSIFLKLLLSLTTLTILEFLPGYINYKNRHFFELPLIFSLASFFMFFLISANHLFVGTLLLMGFSINLYILILFESLNPLVREAGIKYFYLSAFSSGLIIMGVFLLMFVFKTGTFASINFILTAQTSYFIGRSEIFIVFGLTLMLIGLLFKLSAFPGHLWAAEVYGGSPRPVTVLLMINSKIAVFGFTLTLLTQAFDAAISIWQPILAIASTGSMLWGCLGALIEKRLKRFFGYASINQIGFILFGVSCGTLESYRSALLYLFLYIFMSIIIVALFLYPYRLSGSSSFLVYLTDLKGLGKYHEFYNWKFSWVLTLVLFSMAGVPPAAGFFGKYFLLWQAYERGLTLLVLIGLLSSLISMYYYLKLVKIIWFTLPNASTTTLIRTSATAIDGFSLANLMLFFIYSFIFFSQVTLDVFDKLIVASYLVV